MKKKYVILAIFSVFATVIRVYGEDKITIKVMCFNIRMSGQVAAYQAQPFADLILRHRPDVIALQELDYNMPRSGNKDILTEIAELTGMYPLFGKAINPSGGGEYGVAILSKYPIGTSTIVPLAEPAGLKEKRIALVSEIAFPGGFVLKFVSTHLDHSTDAIRTAQVQTINSSKVLYGNLPIILGGDFNAHPNDGAIAAGMARWQRLCDNTNTFPDATATSKIDYIFGYPNKKWIVNSYEVLQTGLSDHRALISEVEYNK